MHNLQLGEHVQACSTLAHQELRPAM